MVTDVKARAWAILEDVADPEIPVVSVLDLGIVRDVVESADGRAVTVTLTPTYSGCPATEVIARDVRTALEASYDEVQVQTPFGPPRPRPSGSTCRSACKRTHAFTYSARDWWSRSSWDHSTLKPTFAASMHGRGSTS